MYKTTVPLVFGMVAVLLMGRDANAQIMIPRHQPPGFGWREGIPLQLVTKSSAVQKELGLSPDAVEKITELQAQIDKEMKLEIERINEEGGSKEGGRSLLSKEQREDSGRKRQETNRILKKRYENRVNELLTSEQQTRLHQIHLQAAGVAALSDAAVVKALGLSDEQQKRIADLYPQTVSAFASRLKGQPQKAPFAFSPFNLNTEQDFEDARDRALLEVLNDEQKKAFDGLKGERFYFLNSLQ